MSQIYIYIGVPTLKVWEAVVGDTGDMQPATRNTQHATRSRTACEVKLAILDVAFQRQFCSNFPKHPIQAPDQRTDRRSRNG